MPVCAKCAQENPDVARFCLACGSPLEAEQPRARGDERKIITAIFVDLVGSTARAEGLDPEDVKALVAPYHAGVRAELERYGGTFEKFMGDGILALFGAPTTRENDPERAVRAALSAREAIARLNAENEWLDLHMRIGVNTGEALVMIGARPSEGEWTAAGDVVNTASRIESAAPPDGILVGELTYRLTRDVIEYRERGPIEAKGKTEPVRVWEVVAPRDDAEPQAPGAPLVGREAELGSLEAFCDEMLAVPRPALASVIGPPGIGKSRLLLELRERLCGRCEVLAGQCVSYEGVTYGPIEAIVKQAAGILRDDDEATGATKLGTLLETLPTNDSDDLRTIAAAISNLAGLATTPQGRYSAAEIGRAELHWGIRRLLELRASLKPTVVVLEDLHWAEPTLLELIAFLAASSAEVPLLLLVSARPEARESGSTVFTSGGNRRAVELDGLGVEASAALVQALADGLDESAVAAALENASGNPLFLEEMVRMLAETGGDAADDGPAVPDTLQALIASRLDQLGPAAKKVAQNGSVIGTSFWPSAVAHLNGIGDELTDGLAELERRDLVRTGGPAAIGGEREYAFKHVLIREVAYGQVPKQRRSRLHARFAEWVEGLPAGPDEFVELVAYHLEQSCLLSRATVLPVEPPPVERAIEALARAADRAERREGFRDAERLSARALELAEDGDLAQRSELRLRRARMLSGLGDLRSAREHLTGAVEDAAAVGRSDLRCAGLVVLANLDWKQGLGADAGMRLEEAERLADEQGDRRLSVRVLFELANVRAWFEGEAAAAIDDLRRALAGAEILLDRALLVEAHLRLGTALVNHGELAESEAVLQRAVDLSGDLGSFRDEVRATTLLGFVKYYRGELVEAERLAEQGLDRLERTSDRDLQVQNLRSLGRYALADGDFALAERRLRAAVPLALELGGWMAVDVYRFLVEALVGQGRTDEAAAVVDTAADAVPGEDPYARAALLIAGATVSTARGDQAASGEAFAEALALLEEQQLELDLGEARIDLARSLQAFGDLAGARAELMRAREVFARMGARTLVDRIDAQFSA